MTPSPSATEAPIYILGGGPAGLAAAYTLAQQGQTVVVVEREGRVGGLAKSITYQGFILDYGPHRFYTKLAPVLKLWDEVLGTEQVTVPRLTRIYYGGKYFNYPLKAVEALSALGLVETGRILFSYLHSRLFPKVNPKNFSEWVTARFGSRLFEIFFEAYTEKLWGIPCAEISADWAAQRIKGLSLLKAIRNAVLGNDGQVKTLIDQFQFPRLGSGQLYDQMSAQLQAQGQTILLHTEVVRLHHQGHRVTNLTLRDSLTGAESTVPCGGVIASVPLNQLVGQMLSPPAPSETQAAAASLKFRNTILVYLIVAGQHLFPDNWLYINEPSVQVGRVTNFANWSPDMVPQVQQTPLCCEYWCNFGDPMWTQTEAELLQLAEQELRRIGLLHQEPIVGGFVLRLPRTYPVYTGDYQAALRTIQAYLQPFENLQLVGRYGAFKYNNQDHSLLMGIMAAENVVRPGQHDLWAVNSDSEYVEEAQATVTTTAVRPHRASKRRQVLATTRQLGRYLLTGGVATAIDVTLFSWLTQTGVWFVWALAASYLVGLTTNFYLSRRFVFGVYWTNWHLQYLVFTAVALNSLLANLGLLQLLIKDLGWQPTPARLVSAAAVAVLSYVGHRLYSFAQTQTARSQSI